MKAPAADEGSIMPLAFGYAALALALILVVAEVTGLYMMQKRLDAVAAAAALAGADGFEIVVGEDGQPRANIIPHQRDELARLVVDHSGGDIRIVEVASVGNTTRVTVGAQWHPMLLPDFLPGQVPLQSVATSRAGLR